MHQRRCKSLFNILVIPLVVIFVFSVTAAASWAQEKTVQDSSGLTDGLLDLITEPNNETPDIPRNDGKLPPVVQPNPSHSFTPADVGLDGEDLGENSSNPLKSVRQSMFIAAGLLQRGTTDATTQEIQTAIIQRLDDLIDQLEKDKPSRNNTTSRQQQAAEQTSQEQSAQSQQQKRSDRSQQSQNSPELSETKPNPQNPGQSGVAVPVEVDLGDPKALQQNVWGHLPERMRTQMQSRMVEQFLPSYREQIEAYFKALLEQQ